MTNNPVSQDVAEQPDNATLARLLEALACDCDSSDGWEEAAPDLRLAASRLSRPTITTDTQSRDGLVERATEKLALWFFRDCNTGTRLCLFSLFGLPLDEITNQSTERHALKYILRHLRTSSGEATEHSEEGINS